MKTTLEEKPDVRGRMIRIEHIRLGKRESVPDPSCTGCKIYGPGLVVRTTWPDGGIDLTVVEGCRR